MINLDHLKEVANTEGKDVVVTRRWLKEVAKEIAEGRAAKARFRANTGLDDMIASIFGPTATG